MSEYELVLKQDLARQLLHLHSLKAPSGMPGKGKTDFTDDIKPVEAILKALACVVKAVNLMERH